MAKHELPHGAWIEDEAGMIFIPVGKVILSFHYEEFLEFADSFQDIVTVFYSHTEASSDLCTSCGAMNSVITYIEPGDEGNEVN